MTFANLVFTSAASLFAAFAIVYVLRYRPRPEPHWADDTSLGAVLLFHDGELADATPDAIQIVGAATTALNDACDLLAKSFPGLRAAVEKPLGAPLRITNPQDDSQWINVHCRNMTVRLELHGDIAATDRLAVHGPAILRDIDVYSPQLIWQQDPDGQVLWANAACHAHTKSAPAGCQPLTACLELDPNDTFPATQRVAVEGAQKQWFDVTTVFRDGYFLHFANDATALVRADRDRREFVQTLGKTFADLSIGLAIFNKKRQLAMFNPALLDLTKLPVDFLSGQPAIDTVLDRLRELRMVPEPKDYGTWREQFTAVEAAAKNGTYSENWSLPDGQTYRVTGRPHPDGAFALLFEDISAEVSLTRRFRSDIETSQAVLDTLPDAIAVFSGSGTMVMSNGAYSRLWAIRDDLMLGHREVQTEFTVWQDSCIASPMWTQMRDFIQRIGTRKPWADDAMLVDGRHLRCHATPIAGGMTMVRFIIAPPMRPVIQKLTQIDPTIRASKV